MFNLLKQNVSSETIVSKILQKEDFLKTLTDQELKENFQKIMRKNSSDDSKIIECFSIVRETAWRTLGLKHYPTQLMGGLILSQGKIAEMKTGEGKTLVATLPASFYALEGKGVHLVTVNDYLAKRDAIWMGKLYRALGLKTGLIQQSMTSEERKKNYLSDITYVTNTELGFDYLRDNFVSNLQDLVLRPFHFCIIDEVDSILIDEARTPLILGGVQDSQVGKYIEADELSKLLLINQDFEVDKKRNSVQLSEKGIFKIENLLNLTDLYDPKDPWISYILNSLKANFIYEKNKDYIVQRNQVLIVDEFTGRIMPDRRWSGGLHQAIEAKERIPIQGETQTLGMITYQNFFVLYPLLSGMTGTAKTAEEELKKIYNLEVVVVPTAKPLQRQDLPDLLYGDQIAKWKAVAKECEKNYKIGRPVLIGTASIQNSEVLSEILQQMNLPHQVLNARPENVERESEIIAQAGRKYALTIATNMAGRGTDIILGGNLNTLIKKQIKDLFFCIFQEKTFKIVETSNLKVLVKKIFQQIEKNQVTKEQLFEQINRLPDIGDSSIDLLLNQIYQDVYNLMFEAWKKENQEVKALGGLYVLGTQRHESQRIDNQLRGRAGRQGDPGISRFFISLDDDLLRLFGGENIKNFMRTLSPNDEGPLESVFLTKTLDQSQKKVESFYYESRKKIFEYDEILNKQRQVLYAERKELLERKNFRELLFQYAQDFLEEYLSKCKEKEDSTYALKNLAFFLGLNIDITIFKGMDRQKIYEFFLEQILISYDLKYSFFDTQEQGLTEKIHKKFILNQIDEGWMNHLQKMTLLRDTIGWRGYGQRDPLQVYKDEAFKFFVEMICKIRYNIVYSLLISTLPNI
jgi:preprotein translocase subunit SecA